MAGLARGEMLLPVNQSVSQGSHGHSVRQGDRGDAVTALQNQLGELGYLRDAQGQPEKGDGHFGPRTLAAVQAFQRDNHLKDDGVAGAATQSAIRTQAEGQAQPQAPARSAILLTDPAHDDHAFFRQAQLHVYQLDAQLGRTPDVYSDNLSGALVVRARENGLQRIDQVALSSDGQQLWAVQTPSGRDDHLFDLRTSLSTNTATTSLEQSSAQWPEAMQKFEMSQQAQQTLTPEQATQQAPNVVR